MSEKFGKINSYRVPPTDFEKEDLSPKSSPEDTFSKVEPAAADELVSSTVYTPSDAIQRASNGGKLLESRQGRFDTLRRLIDKFPKVEKNSELVTPVRKDPKIDNSTETEDSKKIETNNQFDLIEKAKLDPKVIVETEKEERLAKEYFDLEKKSHSKNKKPTRAKLEKARKEYNAARLERKIELHNSVELDISSKFAEPGWEQTIRTHYDKMLARHGGKGNDLLKGELNTPLSFDEYKRKFEKRTHDRYNKLVNIYEVGIPHKERQIAARAERLTSKKQGTLLKALGKLQKFKQKGESFIENSIVGKEFGFGMLKMKISPFAAKQIGKYGMRAATSIGVATGISAGVIGGGVLFGALSGSAALAYLGTKAGRVGLNIFAGSSGGVAAGELYQRFAEATGGEDLRRKKNLYIGSERSMEAFDKSLQKNSREAIARKRQLAETIGTSATTLSLSLDSLYEAVHHFSGVQESAETVIALKHVAEQGHLAATQVGTPVPYPFKTPVGVLDYVPTAPEHVTVTSHVQIAQNHVPLQSTHSATETSAHATTAPVSHPETPAVSASSSDSSIEVSIKPGEGADQLFTNLHKLVSPGTAHSPLTEKILSYKHSHTLAKALGFPEHNSDGVMQPGDSLKIEDHKLILHRQGRSFVLMEEAADKKGKVTVKLHHHIADAKGKLFPKLGHTEAKVPKYVQPVTEQASAAASPELQPVDAGAAHPAEEAISQASAPDTSTPKDLGPLNVDRYNEPILPTPQVENAPHVPAPTTAPTTASTPAPEATPPQAQAPVSSAVEAVPTPPAPSDSPLDLLTHSQGWPEYQHHPSQFLFDNPVQNGNPNDIAFRSEMYDLLKQTGVGPVANEDMGTYVARASEVLSKGTASPVHIIETADHHMVVRGGDFDAQMMIAKEFGRIQAAKQIVTNVLVESTDKNNLGYIDVSNKPVDSGIPGVYELPMLKLSAVKLKGDTQTIF